MCRSVAPPESAPALAPESSPAALAATREHRAKETERRLFSPPPPAEVPATADVEALRTALSATETVTTDILIERHRVAHLASLPYSPTAAANLDVIQSSAMALDEDELAMLEQRGFVITERKQFPTFVYGYETLYLEDLPLYVSADSIVHAVHRSFAVILEEVESVILLARLRTMLDGMRERLPGLGVPLSVRADLDVYLAVAASLMHGTQRRPVAGGDPAVVSRLIEAIGAASGVTCVDLFGTSREIDFSQFQVRGHYLDDERLARYFRAMMWLGRVDFRLVETLPGGGQVLRRRQLEAVLAMKELLHRPALEDWRVIHAVLGTLLGESDDLSPQDLPALWADLGIVRISELDTQSDEALERKLLASGWGVQRVASHVMRSGLRAGTAPLSRTFRILGQRYTSDGHVLANVVYDRTGADPPRRMMPNPLDVAFAALGNDQAVELLAPELRRYRYAPQLAAMRILVDAQEGDSLYERWLGALRTLSPLESQLAAAPSVARTEAWGRRVLNTQLASWAELRHDTMLYVAQSYTNTSTCEYPDAYVDPYPRFYAAITALARRGLDLAQVLAAAGEPGPNLGAYFQRLADVAALLGDMAVRQRAGLPLTEAHLRFINRAVTTRPARGCTPGDTADGWYAELFYDREVSTELRPTIADVHTQPFDELGRTVGRVLHVGTGLPRLMVVTVDTCGAPRAYAGLVSAYFERTTGDFERLNDTQWANQLETTPPIDVPWMRDLVARYPDCPP